MSLDKKSLEHCVTKGIIIPTQMEQMLREDSVYNKTNFGDLVSKIILIGSVLFGFGIITWIATNWESIPDIVKICGTLLVIFASFWTAEYVTNKLRYMKVGEGVYLIGGFAIGGLFALISQIYNLDTGKYSGLLLMWFVATLAPLYLFRSRMLSILVSVLFSATATTYILEQISYNTRFEHIALVVLSQIVIFLVGGFHYKYNETQEIGRLFRVTSIIFGTISFLLLTFSFDMYSSYPYYNLKSVENYIYLYPIVLVLLLTFLSYIYKVFVVKEFHYVNVFLSLLSLLLYATLVGTLMDGYTNYVLLNLTFILALVLTLYISVIRKDKTIMNFAVLVSCMYIFAKSISWLEMLNGYVFFMSIGLIFILVGYVFEKIRRELLEKINQ
jgi:uncharacterized membrane protein